MARRKKKRKIRKKRKAVKVVKKLSRRTRVPATRVHGKKGKPRPKRRTTKEILEEEGR